MPGVLEDDSATMTGSRQGQQRDVSQILAVLYACLEPITGTVDRFGTGRNKTLSEITHEQ